MELGSLEETVSVEAAGALVETRNPAVGATINSDRWRRCRSKAATLCR
jgi:hypothetical protein